MLTIRHILLVVAKIPIQLNYTHYSEVTSDVLWVDRSIVIQSGAYLNHAGACL